MIIQCWLQWDIFSGCPEAIDESTLCRCTGLKDKNGTLIWENDILMCCEEPKNLVKAAFGKFAVKNVTTNENVDQVIGWYYDVISAEGLSGFDSLNLSCIPMVEFYTEILRVEVVGNSLDDPKLLKKTKK